MTTITKDKPDTNKKSLCTFRVLAGKHYEGRTEKTPSNPKGDPICYFEGDLVESNSNLLLLNGDHDSMKKFELVEGDVSVYPPKRQLRHRKQRTRRVPQNDGLEGYTTTKLRQIAEEEEIQLDGAKSRNAILDILRSYSIAG